MSKRITDYTLYRLRYVISYVLIALLLLFLVWGVTVHIPGGLRYQEISTLEQTGAISKDTLDPSMVINLPYHVLQRLSIFIFGVTTFSIKLPSLILATLTVLGVYMLVRTWFKENIAVISTIVLATTTHFLFLAQDGTPSITLCAIAIWIMVAGMYVTRGKYFHTFWKIFGGVLMGIALYIPLGIYLDIIMLTVIFIHPHIRAIFRKLRKTRLFIAFIVGAVAVAPLVYAIIIDPSPILKTLLGAPDRWADIPHNAIQAVLSLFGFAATTGTANGILQPAYGIVVAAIALLGFSRLFAAHYTARSYVTIMLCAIFIPLALINPNNISTIFIVMTIAVATGFDYLIRFWYRLFPHNPYARLSGLLPLSILVGGMVLVGALQYVDGYQYNPAVATAYSTDLTIINNQLSKNSHTTLLISADESPLYNLVAHYNKSLTTKTNTDSIDASTIVVSKAANKNIPSSWHMSQIVTNNRSTDSDRFYIYKKS